MTDLPRRAVTRGARLAALPIGYAGRTALGLGKRVGGKTAEDVASEIQMRTAEQVFKTLGELKGGAMKFGQAMSIFEVALPDEVLGPYRATLTKLQDAAPPMPAETVHKVLAEALGDDWRDRFTSFDDKPAAAASIVGDGDNRGNRLCAVRDLDRTAAEKPRAAWRRRGVPARRLLFHGRCHALR